MLTPTTRTQITSAMIPSHFPISSVLFSRGVFSCDTDTNAAAILPNSVLIPVAVTIAFPLP